MKTLFDMNEASLQRDKGMQLAAERKAELVTKAKDVAHFLAATCGETNADDVQRYLIFHGNCEPLGNAASSIFRGKEWECIGWKKSERVSNHARSIRIWKLKGN